MRLTSSVAQHFQAFDHVVVLGDRKILEQGTWQEIKMIAASIPKFAPGYHVKINAVLSANFDKLQTQILAKDEAEVDLSRQTGDLALYGVYLSNATLSCSN